MRPKVMSALRWSASARLLGQLFSWVITIAVIRLLSPADYGLMAMAVVLVSFAFLLNTLGLDAVLVQSKDLSASLTRQIFGVVVLANLGCFAALFLGADAAAAFYGAPELAPVLRLLSLQFPLLMFETLPLARLEREINFAARSVVDLVTLVIGSLTTLTLALLDYGVWALVWGMLANTFTRVLGLNVICPAQVWPSFRVTGMRRHFAFGSFVASDRGLWYIFSESDKFIGGKLLGNQALGYYAVANQIASLPIQKISGLLNAIAFPAFSHAHAHTSREKVRDYLLTSTRMLSIAAFPVFLGLAATAESVVAVLLGVKWLPAAPLLQLLALVMPFRLLSNVFPPLLWGMGKPRISASNYLLAAMLMPVAFYVGAHWGALGLACAWLAMYPPVFLAVAWRSCHVVGIGLRTYLGAMLRPLAAALLMLLVVMTVGSQLPGEEGSWLHLLMLIVLGAGVYTGCMLLIDRRALADALYLVRS